MFEHLGRLVTNRAWWCVGLWAATTVLAAVTAPEPDRLRLSEPASVLPDHAASEIARRIHTESFPDQSYESQIVLVFHRPDGLQTSDRQWIAETAAELERVGPKSAEPWRVLSSRNPALKPRLESEDGQAAMLILNLDVNFITHRAAVAVTNVEELLRPRLPAGLTLAITGSASIGREHNIRSQTALERTTWVTVVSVLIILAMVYRSPLGALVPLFTIGLSVYLSFRLLDVLSLAGWSISNAERTFTVVLLFGAGTDYALFWIARYKEELDRGLDFSKAAIVAMQHVGPAILTSAATVIFGLSMLMLADMVIVRNAGKVLGMVLAVSLLSAMILTPAVVFLMGRAFFWPVRLQRDHSASPHRIWHRVAGEVVRRPAGVLIMGLLLIGFPAWSSWSMPLRYDSFGELPKGSTAERGLELTRKHFSGDSLFSSRILVQCDQLGDDLQGIQSSSAEMTTRLREVEDVTDVWSLDSPLGQKKSTEYGLLLAIPEVHNRVLDHYFSQNRRLLQFELMQSHPPLSQQATVVLNQAIQAIQDWAHSSPHRSVTVYALGLTPYIVDVQAIADRDLRVVVFGVVLVIWLTILLLARKFWLTMFMMLATLVTYGAALGLTHWIFVGLLGEIAVDYKIKILVFVIIVAVGQDYNIFLVSRILQELRSYDLSEAVRRSIVLTGPVISSCGLIMAATLGSLVTTDVQMTRQLGCAFVVGVLIDTFLVRPLLIPSFYLLLERKNRFSVVNSTRQHSSTVSIQG